MQGWGLYSDSPFDITTVLSVGTITVPYVRAKTQRPKLNNLPKVTQLIIKIMIPKEINTKSNFEEKNRILPVTK